MLLFVFQIVVFNSGIIKIDNGLYHSLKGLLLEKNTVFYDKCTDMNHKTLIMPCLLKNMQELCITIC